MNFDLEIFLDYFSDLNNLTKQEILSRRLCRLNRFISPINQRNLPNQRV